jgi:purine-binding chemotaxis protein CheW
MTRLCTFELGGMTLALPADDVREVIRHGQPTPVPLAPPDVIGLINLRGEIATVIDVARRLGRAPAPADGGLGLVLRDMHGTVCLRVDRAGDVLEIGEEAFEPPPETLKGEARDLVRGTYKVGNALVLLLDTGKAVPA